MAEENRDGSIVSVSLYWATHAHRFYLTARPRYNSAEDAQA
jgi:hypothetical protein